MKKLILMRHATYKRSDAASDYEYGLSSAGRKEAKQAADFMQKNGFKPDLILCSSAKRALQTATLVADYFSLPVDNIIEERKLYLSSPETILDSVKAIPKGFLRILVVAHNPGVSVLVKQLSNSHAVSSFPPSGFGIFDFEDTDWSCVEGKSLTLSNLYYI